MIYEYPLEQWHDVHGSRLKLLDFVIAGIDLAAIYWRYRRHTVQHDASAVRSNGTAFQCRTRLDAMRPKHT